MIIVLTLLAAASIRLATELPSQSAASFAPPARLMMDQVPIAEASDPLLRARPQMSDNRLSVGSDKARQASTSDAPASRAEQAHAVLLEDAVRTGKLQKIEAVLVEHHGERIYEVYFGDTVAETRFDARSAGKSITALAVGAAIDDHNIASVNERVLVHLLRGEAATAEKSPWHSITVRDFLTMSSALDCNDWDENSPGNEERMYETTNWTQFALAIPIRADYQRDASGLGAFSYCTAGAFLLGRIIERASGLQFDRYVEKRLFEPLDIQDPVWRRSPTGEVQSGGQLSLRASDFLALARLVLNQGRAEGHQLLSATWIQEMLTPVRQATRDEAFGYLWWTRTFKGRNSQYQGHFMSGNGGNKVLILPELSAALVVLSSNYNQPGMHQQTTRIVEEYLIPMIEDRIAAKAIAAPTLETKRQPAQLSEPSSVSPN